MNFFREEWKNIRTLEDFFTYWTLKESVIKTSGLGLKQNLQEIQFEKKNFEFHIEKEKNLQFKTMKIDENHILSLTFSIKESKNFEMKEEFIDQVKNYFL